MYRGQLAIISLKGMEKFVPGSTEFIKEAASRALSNSEKGHIVIDDLSEGARFSGNLPEGNYNEGAYLGVKTFAMTPGDEFGIMLVPNDTFKFLSDYPTFGGDKRPLFSMVTANPNEAFHLGQIADITGEGNTFAMEDMRFDSGSDKDYNDLTFQVRGAKGKAALMDSVVNPDKDWRKTDLGKAIIAYATPYITPEPKPTVDDELSDLLDDLETEILNPSTSEKETPTTPAPATNTDKNTTDATQVETTDLVDAKPTTPAVTTEEEVKDTANNSGDSTKAEIPEKVDAKPTTPAVTTEEEVKDIANKSGDSTKVETTDKVDTKPTAGATTTPTSDKDTVADSTEKLPIEKTPVSPQATEVKDEVTEAPATPTLPAKSTVETEVAATTPTEKVETQPEVLPAESLTKVETKPEVLPAKTPAKEESKQVLVTDVEKTETPKVVVATNPVESVKESQPTTAVESKETPAVVPPLAAQTMPVVGTNIAVDSQKKEIVTQTETGGVNDAAPKESLPIYPTVEKPTEDNSTVTIAPPAKEELAQNYQDVNADWIARLESIKQRLSNLGSADVVAENAIDRTLIARLETMTEKLREQTKATPVSDNTAALISRLEDMVVKVAPPAIEPIQPVQFEFPVANQPLVGVIDTGFSGNNPDIDYSRIILGRDRVSNDANPLLATGEGSEHGTHILGIIGATQNNGVGIDGVNDRSPLWVGRAIGSGQWAESLVEFVNAAIESNQPNAVVNLSLDLTQVNPDGSVTTRYEFTPEERSAIEYARQHNVLLVVAAGNDGGVMSVLGQASQEFDNIITVGAAERVNDEIALSKAYDRSDYSSYGAGLDILADGGTVKNPVLSTTGDGVGAMAGTSVATAKVTGAVSQVWAANPSLSYRQVIQIIKDTATDLKTPNWDGETGAGLLNMVAAVAWAEATMPKVYQPAPWVTPDTWSGEGTVTPEERAAKGGNSLAAATVQASSSFSDSDRVDSNQPEKYYQFTVTEPGYVSWNLTSLNPVSGFPTPPQVTVTKADGKPGSHTFFKGASLQTSIVGEGQTSFQGGNFYDPGTYYLKVGNGAGSSFNDYNISTQFIADRVSSFTGNIQYRTQPYYSLDNSLQSAVFSGPAVSELSNLSGVVTYDNIQFNNRIAKYGMEVNESGKIRINLNSPNGKMEVSVKKFIGSDDRPESIASLEVSANSDGWLELDLNKGRYDIEVKTPSNVWLEPDWNSTQQTLVRPYTLNATFAPNAPQPGQGQVPSSAGAFDKTVISNGVVNHYYKNGYLTVQPSGQASWYSYGTGKAIGVIEISAVPLPFEIPPDYAGNSPDKARDIGTLIGTQTFHDVIDRNDRFDYYKFNITSESKVDFALSGKMGNTGFYLFQDWYFNSDDSTHIDIISGIPPNGVVPEFSQTLKPGSYYVLVHKPKDYDGDEYDLKLSATPVGDPDGNYSIQTAANVLLPSGGADLGDGVNSNQVGIGYILSSIGGNDLNDFYKFSFDSLKLVNFQLSQSGTGAQWWLLQDRNGNGQVDPGEEIKTGTLTTEPLDLDVILGAGDYYLQVGSLSSDATSVYAVNVSARSPENQVIAGYGSDYYLVQNGRLRRVPNQETLNALKIDLNTVKHFLNEDLARIPDGDDLPSRKDGDVFQDLSGRIYLMQSGKRRFVPDWDTLRAIGINVTVMPTFPESDLKDIELGDPYAPPIPQWQKEIDNTYQYARNLLGNPIGDYGRTISSLNKAQGYGRNYDNGTVYWSDRSGAIALWYSFKDTYNQNGSYSGWLGFPTKANENWKDGQRIDFEGGYIYWDGQQAKAYHPWETPQQNLNNTVGYDGTNTHQTYVGTFNRNGGSSALGSATGNVHPLVANGYIQEFSGGSEGSGAIMKSGANDNSYWVGGAFWTEYQDAVSKGINLDYPTSDRYRFNGGWKQDFKGGSISTAASAGGGSNNGGNNNSPIDGMTPYEFGHLGTLDDTLYEIAARELGNGNRWGEIRKYPDGPTYTEAEARQIQRGTFVYLPKSSGSNNNTGGGTGNTGGSNNNNTLLGPVDVITGGSITPIENSSTGGGSFNNSNNSGGSVGPIAEFVIGATEIEGGGSFNNSNNSGGSVGPIAEFVIGATEINDSPSKTDHNSYLELGLKSLSWTKQSLEELDWLINNGNQFELPISSDQDNLLLKKFANRPGTGKEFNYGEYIQLKGLNYRLKNAIDYTTQTDDLIEDYIDSIADSEDSDTALKLYNLKQSWELGRKQAKEAIQQKLSWVNYPWLSYLVENLTEGGRIIVQNSSKGAFYSISAYLRINALIKGGPLAKLSSYYSQQNYWQREESERISKDLGKLADGLGWILSNKLGDLQEATEDITKPENFSKLASVVSAIGGDIIGWMDKNRVSGFAGLSGDLKDIYDEIEKIRDIDKILTGQSGIYLDEDDREFLNAVKFFSSAQLMSAAFSMLLNLSKLAGIANDMLATIESLIKIFKDANVIIEEGYNVISRGNVRNSYDWQAWSNELYNSEIKIDKEYITGVAEVLGDYLARQ
ncbi:S8 family serine peptidase [Microcoleus sp. A003_D6]|uniref:S8 family serine peptidase n=1 Tax=Microcoleus sp. A003_D6 TaxID=3055266 RepID=UPI002FCFD8F4